VIPGEYAFDVYQWCSLDDSCFEVWVINCNGLLNLVFSKLCFGNDIEGDWKCTELFISCKDFFNEC
jgi:hypothetical protein